MTKSILLVFLAIATTPFIFADAIATSDIEVVSQPKKKELNLNSSCTSLETSSDCLSLHSNAIDTWKISSEVWLKDVAGILLSGSMFSGCRSSSKHKSYFERGTSPASGRNSLDPTCLFSWQNHAENKLEIQQKNENLLSNSLVANPNFSNNSAPIVASSDPTQFPKISRSSLIVDLPPDSTFKPKNNKLANPAPKTKRIASPFGWRRRPYSYQLQFHQGIDYGAPLGSPVVAVGDGIVTKVVSGCYDFGNLFCGGQLGNWIEIDHGDGAIGIYGHLKNNSIAIDEGMKVWKNQEIAQVGSSGWSTGAHLDFRMKVNGEYEDPAKYLTPPDFSNLDS